MSGENYESHGSSGDEYENTEEEKKCEAMIKTESLQSQFAGYYYDGKSSPEMAKQFDRIMIDREDH